ncbi:MAG TPA: amino acid ABC transporter ATP-binding protein [Fastidiosipila sp.]|nr:amino acid ABC transporter ATP-binding protein [Fastidiosipila sp.]
MLTIEGLTKRYGALVVLDNISLTIERGEIVSVIGPSGGGKTTLLRMIDLLEPADRGEMTLGDLVVDLKRPGKKTTLAVRRRIGFVFQQFNLFSHRTVKENILDALIYGHGYAKPEAEKRAAEVIAMVDLEDKTDAYPITLSGGQAQRAAIARAIAPSPDLLILDEPTSALDPELTGEVIAVIKALATQGMTMLLVTHHIGLARELADRVLVLDAGRFIEEGPVANVLEHPQTDRTRSFLERVRNLWR